jgi:hypothetical protein
MKALQHQRSTQMKSNFTPTCKAATAVATFGAIILLACTPMAALAHSVSSHGGGKNQVGLLGGIVQSLGLGSLLLIFTVLDIPHEE